MVIEDVMLDRDKFFAKHVAELGADVKERAGYCWGCRLDQKVPKDQEIEVPSCI